MEKIKNINEWEILTPNGWSNFDSIKKITKNYYYKILFNNGSIIEGSENHKIKMKNGEFRYLSCLMLNEVTYNNLSVVKKIKINKEIELYDLLNVEKDNEYYTNDIVSHNCAFIRDVNKLWASSYPTLSTGGAAILLSTPNGVSNLFHQTWVAAENGQNNFKSIKVHWTENPEFAQGLTRDEEGNYISPWYADQCKGLNNDPRKISQELDLDFLGSGDLVIRSEYLKEIKDDIRKPINSDFINKFIIKREIEPFTRNKLWLWKEPEKNHDYVLCADPSRGDSEDYSAFHILDLSSMHEQKEQVMEYYGRIPPDDFAKVIYYMGMLYNRAFVICECNSIGLVTTLKLEEMKYPKMYYFEKNSKVPGRSFRYTPDNIIKERLPGFQTTSGNRNLVIAQLEEEIRNGVIVIYSNRLFQELTTFIYRNGRPEADAGYHDDLTMAMSIGLYVIATSMKSIISHKVQTAAMLKNFSIRRSSSLDIANIKSDDENDNVLYLPTSTGEWEDCSWVL